MGKERLVEIKVFGQTYTVKTDAEEDYIQEVAKYVNEKMEEVLKKTKSVSTLNVAILTALNIADDLLREKEKRTSLCFERSKRNREIWSRRLISNWGGWNSRNPPSRAEGFRQHSRQLSEDERCGV